MHTLYYSLILRPTQTDVPLLDVKRKRLVSYIYRVHAGHNRELRVE